MKIVEFGDDGKPRLLKQAEAPVAREVIADDPAAGGKIKIREFDRDGAEEAPRKTSVAAQGPFGAARVPQSIKIVDFDKEKAGTPIKPAPAQERPRGMKIVETD
jgi:hypothetical protein